MTRHRAAWSLMLLILLLAQLTGCQNSNSHGVEIQPTAAAEPAGDDLQQRIPLADSCRWLWNQQLEDGSWRSGHYGLLKTGQAYTPFVLHTLLEVPESVFPRPPEAVEQALTFIRSQINQQGAIGMADPDVLEYPNYSTAYALLCLLKTDPDDPLVGRMADYLKKQQYRESRGFSPEHPAYGGWGFGGTLPDGQPGHMDLAHTRRILQALSAAAALDSDTATAAEQFLRLVQRHPACPQPQPQLEPRLPSGGAAAPYDGGFYFSPVVLAANKGRTDIDNGRPYLRSYASASCDGVLALLAIGLPTTDERVVRAIEWLTLHREIDYPAGVPADHPEPWGEAVHFYDLAVRADAHHSIQSDGSWRELINDHLATLQKADGHFVNQASPLMKEDDPLLATSLAVIALTHATLNSVSQ